ncbi:MAG: hypothetical protein QOJ91_1692 [Sphingomonadales bacterium]|jgi:uncharacterized membrane protein|nr:hypothetical protein [Sphingomonadales bacterium]
MNALLWIHIAAGCLALVAGAVAIVAFKGGSLHARAGTGFVASMLVLGTTASFLEPFRNPPGSPVGGIIVCYFVATAWMTARRRDGKPGRFEMIACALALGGGALTALGGFTGAATTPLGPAPVFVFAGICLLAGLGDLRFVRRGRLTAGRRLSRHVWRMCVAFFIATGSFFLGQQGAMPAAVRGSLLLFVPAFAPFAVMIFWLVRIRFPNALARLKLRVPEAADTEKGGVEPVSKRRAAA